MSTSARRLVAAALRAVGRATARGLRTTARGATSGTRRTADRVKGHNVSAGSSYPGDFRGRFTASYAPNLDGAPDPGEIVWTWVPFEEDHTQGKDRPVLLVGHDGAWLLGLMLSSRDHDARPSPRGELWVDIGSGSWDSQRRPSEVRVDRVIRVDPATVRREGAVLDHDRFVHVVGSLPTGLD